MENKIKWHKIGRRRNMVYFFNLISSGLYDENYEKILGFKLGINAFRNYCYEIGYKENEFNEGVKNIKKELSKRGPKFFIKLAFKLSKKGKRLVEYSSLLINKKPDKKEISKILDNIIKFSRDYSPVLVLANIIEPVIEEELRNKINKKVKDKKLQEEYFQLLTTTELIDETEYELDELRKIQVYIRENKIKSLKNKTVQNKIKKHLKKWSWVFSGRSQGKISVSDIENRLKKEIAEKTIEEKKNEIKNKSKEVIKKIGIDKDYVELVKIYVYFRTHRMNLFLESSYNLSFLLKHISNLIGVEEKYLFQMSLEELKKVVKEGEIDMIELGKRLDYENVFILSQNGILYITIIEKIGKVSVSKQKIIKGNPAFLGKVKGKVKIVNEISDTSKVKRGDVLVASMTIPEFIQAMERASAFVTDEGGILCHAAIVSREMKKPCIIGTKIATQVLKDGDMVEMDAGKGIVKIIK